MDRRREDDGRTASWEREASKGTFTTTKPYRTVVHVNPKLLPGNEIFGHDMHHQTFINAFSFCNKSEAWKVAEKALLGGTTAEKYI